MNIKTWLKSASDQLNKLGYTSANLDGQLILSHILGQNRAYLLSHADDILNEKDANDANNLLGRRLKNEPLAFLVGTKEFYGLSLKTDSRALIPRGESETLVQKALEWLKKQPSKQLIVEIGTGSGAIILALAQNAPHHTFIATEISPEALTLAQENAKSLGLENITFLPGNLGEPLLKSDYIHKINLLVANLPYIPTGLLSTLDPTITYYEPNVALDGGKDGLRLYADFMPQIKELLAPEGLVLLEHDHDQGQAMQNLTRHYFPGADIRTIQDYLGQNRILSCQFIT